MTRTLFLLRHAQSEANAARVYPPDETPLTRYGIAQAAAAASFVQSLSVSATLVSPLVRARDTAILLGVPARTVQELRDRELGAFTGKTYGAMYETCQAQARDIHSFVPEGGESYAQARERVARAYAQFPQGDILVIAHADTLHWLVELETGTHYASGLQFENCALWVIENGEIAHKNWRPWVVEN